MKSLPFAVAAVLAMPVAAQQTPVLTPQGVNYGNGAIVRETTGNGAPSPLSCSGIVRYTDKQDTARPTWLCVNGTMQHIGIDPATVAAVVAQSAANVTAISNEVTRATNAEAAEVTNRNTAINNAVAAIHPFSGNYNDLTNLPNLSQYVTTTTFTNGTAAQCRLGNGALGTCGGASTTGLNQYTPVLANGSGGLQADPAVTIVSSPAGVGGGVARSLKLVSQTNYNNQVLAYNSGQNIFYGTYAYLPTWNYGSYQTPSNATSFVTTAFHTMDIVAVSHTSSIVQPLSITTALYNMGDKTLFAYIYGNFMPGVAVAGSDEGVAGIRFGMYPSPTYSALLATAGTEPNGAANNATGSVYLRFTSPRSCHGSGSSFGSGSCLTPGQQLADLSDPVYTNLHAVGYSIGTINSPTIITTAASDPAMTPDTIISSTTSLDRAASVQYGDTVTIPFTAPNGFVDPQTGYACVSSASGHTDEAMKYTISGSNITFSDHRFDHNTNGGSLTIALTRTGCNAASFPAEEANNNAGSTNGGGKTYYSVVGVQDAHHLLVSQYHTGQRYDGQIYAQRDIHMDGGSTSLFNVYPAAKLIDVADPTYTPFAIYGFSPSYGHVEDNNVTWAAGKTVEAGYLEAEQTFMERLICDSPLADMSFGSECRYVEVRGSIQQVNHYRFTNDPVAGLSRGLPNLFYFEPYNNNNTAGAIGYFARGGMTPTYGWLVSTRTGPGGALDTPTGAHYLWCEGCGPNQGSALVNKSIVVDDGNNKVRVGGMLWEFNGAVNFLQAVTGSTSIAAPTIKASGGLFGYYGFFGSAGSDQTTSEQIAQDVNRVTYFQNNSGLSTYFMSKGAGTVYRWCAGGVFSTPASTPATNLGCNANASLLDIETGSWFATGIGYIQLINNNYNFNASGATFTPLLTLNGGFSAATGTVTTLANTTLNTTTVNAATINLGTKSVTTVGGYARGMGLYDDGTNYDGIDFAPSQYRFRADVATPFYWYGCTYAGAGTCTQRAKLDAAGFMVVNSLGLVAAAAPATPVDGQSWYNTVTGSYESMFGNLGGVAVRKVFTGLSSTVLTNPTTAASLLPTTFAGTNTLPANYLQAKRTFRVVFGGVYSSAVMGQSMTLAVKFGGATITAGSSNFGAVTNTNQRFNGVLEFTVRSCSGSTCTLALDGGANFSVNGMLSRANIDLDNNGATFTINNSQANTLDLLANVGTSDSGSSITLTSMQITEQ